MCSDQTKSNSDIKHIIDMDRKLQEKYLECLNFKSVMQTSDNKAYIDTIQQGTK